MTSFNSQRIFFVSRILTSIALLGLMFLSGCAFGADSVATQSSEIARTSMPSPTGSDQPAFRYRLTPAPLHETTPRQRESPPFRLLASGSERARIVDGDGDVIRSASPRGTIFSFQMSSNQQWLLLYFGGGKYSVASSESLEDVVRPPIRPDGFDDATGFTWIILDDDHLIGQADLPSLETEGLTASEKESLPPRDTLIYIYTIASGTMTPVEIDEALPRLFHITGVFDGHISLLPFFSNDQIGAKTVQASNP